MKTILSTLLAALVLLTALVGCGRDATGETRVTPSMEPSAAPSPDISAAPPTMTPADSTADGVIDEGKDAVDGVIGAGEDAVDDLLRGGEDVIDDAADAVEDMAGGHDGDAPKTSPAASPKG